LHHGADYTPFEGIEVTGFPVRTILRGKTLVADGKLHQAKGVGRYLKRAKSQDASMGLESSISIK
jgi:dihydropyrimidinase